MAHIWRLTWTENLDEDGGIYWESTVGNYRIWLSGWVGKDRRPYYVSGIETPSRLGHPRKYGSVRAAQDACAVDWMMYGHGLSDA